MQATILAPAVKLRICQVGIARSTVIGCMGMHKDYGLIPSLNPGVSKLCQAVTYDEETLLSMDAQLLFMNVASSGHEVMLWQRLQLRLRLRLRLH